MAAAPTVSQTTHWVTICATPTCLTAPPKALLLGEFARPATRLTSWLTHSNNTTTLSASNAFPRNQAVPLTTAQEFVPHASQKKFFRMEPVIAKLEDAKTTTLKPQYLAGNAKADMSRHTICAILKLQMLSRIPPQLEVR